MEDIFTKCKINLMMLLSALFALSSFILSQEAHAKTYDGVTFPNKVSVGKTQLALNGTATEAVTIFDIEVFVAALYLKEKLSLQKIFDTKPQTYIILNFVHDIDSATLSKNFLGTLDKVCQSDCATIKKEATQSFSKIHDIKNGEILNFNFSPNQVIVSDKSKALTTLSGSKWYPILLSLFIGQHAPSDTFSNDLLGLSQ